MSGVDPFPGQLCIRAKREEFWEFTTIEFDQGGFARPGREKRLLSEVGSEGVCQSMVLDFLGAGGSKREAGNPTEGQITSGHLSSQAAYAVQGQLRKQKIARVRSERKDLSARIEKGPDQKLNIQVKILESEIEIDTQEKEVLDLEGYVTDVNEEIRLAELELERRATERAAAVKSLRGVEGAEDVLATIDIRVAEVEETLKDLKNLRGLLLEQLPPARQLLAELKTNHDALGVDFTAAETKLTQLRTELVSNRETIRKLTTEGSTLKKNKVSAKATPVPTSVLEKYGIDVKADKASEVASANENDVLTASQIVAELERRFTEADDDVATSYNLCAKFMSGGSHAIGLRGTKHSDLGTWDIEYFDPNNGAYRFKRLEDFKGFFPKWYVKFYGGGWRSISLCVLDIKGTHKSTDPQSLLGPTAEVAWSSLWQSVEELRPKVLASAISGATKARVNAAYKKIASVFPVDNPASATQVDLKIGSVYVERFQELGAVVLDQAVQWENRLDGVLETLDEESDMDDARALLEQARSLHEADNLGGALDKLGEVETEIKRVTGLRD